MMWDFSLIFHWHQLNQHIILILVNFFRGTEFDNNHILGGPLIQLILSGGYFHLKLELHTVVPKKWGNDPNNDGTQKYGYLSDK